MIINALLCEDSNIDLESEKKLIEKAFKELKIKYDLKCCSNSDDINEKRIYDIVFLDIELPGRNGVEIARKLLIYNKNCKIMFITNYPVYLDKAFDINAFRFFQKPLEYDRLRQGIENAVKRIRDEYAVIKVNKSADNKAISVNLSNIVYIENSNRRTRIITEKHDFTVKEPFSYVKEMISKKVDYFISTHNSLFVNYKYIRYYDKLSVYLGREDSIIRLDISRRYYQSFANKFFELVEESI